MRPAAPPSPEAQLVLLNRSLSLLAAVNEEVVRAASLAALVEKVCEAAVTVGAYRMAWIGQAVEAPGRPVRPLAVAGEDCGYVAAARISWADDEQGRGPTGRAIRERKTQVARFIATDPSMAPWREAALRHGYASSAAMPLIVDRAEFGALTVYSERPDAFDQQELLLLEKLARDVAYGIRALATRETAAAERARLERIEAALQQSEQRFRSLVENTSDIIAVARVDGTITYVSPAVRAVSGYEPAELLGHSYLDLVYPEDLPEARAHLADMMRRPGEPIRYQMRFRHRDGSARVMENIVRNLAGVPGIDGIAVNMRDVTEREQQQQALRRTNRALKALSAGNSAVMHAASEPELLAQMCRAVVEDVGYAMAWVGFVEHDAARSVRVAAWNGHNGDYVEQARITWTDNERGRGPAGRCIREGKAQVVRDVESDPTMAPWREKALAQGYRSLVSLPLVDPQGVFGVMNIYSAERNAFDTDELQLLANMAGDLTFGLVAMRTRVSRDEGLQRLERSMEATVRALAGTVELRDPYTAGHQRRVAAIAGEIARALGWPADRRRGLTLAASIHDVGKLTVPAEILAKPTRLTAVELALVQGHAEAGYQILKGIELPWPVAEVIRQHHERLDGSGYPRGLKDEQILAEAKIVAVADAVEAIASHRPYRAARGLDTGLREIASGRGTLYAADVVDACLELFRGGYGIPD